MVLPVPEGQCPAGSGVRSDSAHRAAGSEQGWTAGLGSPRLRALVSMPGAQADAQHGGGKQPAREGWQGVAGWVTWLSQAFAQTRRWRWHSCVLRLLPARDGHPHPAESPGVGARLVSRGVTHTWDKPHAVSPGDRAGDPEPWSGHYLLTPALVGPALQAWAPAPPTSCWAQAWPLPSRGYGQQVHPRRLHSALVSHSVRWKFCCLST